MDDTTLAVTVIVPVYNVAPYIERCARSLFEQTLENLEIIFVDDCSPDNSVDIIERVLEGYPKRRETTKIIKKEVNGGLSAARKQGIIESRGDYIIHCDGDDWTDPDLYRKMYKKAKETGADIVMCGEKFEFADQTKVYECKPMPSSGKELVRNWYRDTMGMFCHDKMVKRSLYVDNGILPWEGLNMWEDNGLMTRLFYHCNKLEVITGVFYHYNRANQNAMTAGYGEKQVRQMIGIANNLGEFFESQADYKDFENTALAFKYLAKLNLVTDSYTKYREFKKIFPESNKIRKYIPLHSFSTKGKIRFLMVKYKLGLLFVTLFKAYNKLAAITSSNRQI